jgi:hypothetical protein
MRLAILLGLILSWAGGVGGQALAHPTGNIAGAPALLSISAQPVTPTITLSDPVGPIITSTAASAITATVATTATETIASTPTATATPAGPPPPTVAVPVVDAETPLQINPFDANFLFSKARPPMGPFAWTCFGLMILLLGVSGYFYAVKRPQWKRTNSVLHRAANRFSQPGMWLAILGLFLVLFRIVGLDFFDKRFWLYLWLLGVIGVGAWFLYWYRTRYPKELEKFRKTQRAKQYMPGGSARTPARQPERTTPKPAPQPRPAPKPSGSTPPPRPSGDKKRGKGR